eukprot:15431776-Alexandrium_andersonii.AAC.1
MHASLFTISARPPPRSFAEGTRASCTRPASTTEQTLRGDRAATKHLQLQIPAISRQHSREPATAQQFRCAAGLMQKRQLACSPRPPVSTLQGVTRSACFLRDPSSAHMLPQYRPGQGHGPKLKEPVEVTQVDLVAVHAGFARERLPQQGGGESSLHTARHHAGPALNKEQRRRAP